MAAREATPRCLSNHAFNGTKLRCRTFQKSFGEAAIRPLQRGNILFPLRTLSIVKSHQDAHSETPPFPKLLRIIPSLKRLCRLCGRYDQDNSAHLAWAGQVTWGIGGVIADLGSVVCIVAGSASS